MNNIIKMSVAAAVMMTVGTSAVQAEDISILSNIKVKGEIRARYEIVESDNNVVGSTSKRNANAITNRLVLGVGADVAGTDWLSVYGEMTDVHSLNPNNYNSTDNGGGNGYNPGFGPFGAPLNVVADPEQTRLTQAYIDVHAAGVLLRSGRQMINLDNQRFIGAVGWRQMPQTYDGFLLAYSGVENLNLAAAYLTKVNTIKAGAADHLNTRSVVLHASYKVADFLTVTAYDYMLGAGTGVNNGTANGVGSDTIGLALTGKPKISDNLTINYRAEYAVMVDPSMESSQYEQYGPIIPGDDNYDADYYNLELGVNFSGFLAQIGYEVQSGTPDSYLGRDNKTFSTALGTNHAFSGWADVFLATPDQGLEDMNLMLGYKSKKLGLFKVVYHDFQSEVDGIDYGQEIDLLYKRAIPGVKGLTGMLKYANYNADDAKVNVLNSVKNNPRSTDVQKFWFMLDYKFSN